MSATRLSPAVALLEQERDLLRLLLNVAGRQEAAMIAADVPEVQRLTAEADSLVRQELGLSRRLAGLPGMEAGIAGVIASLPEEHRGAADRLAGEVRETGALLSQASARLQALSQSALDRVNFMFTTLAGAAEKIGPYTAPGKQPAGGVNAVVNRCF